MKYIQWSLLLLVLGVLIGYSPVAVMAQTREPEPQGVQPGVIEATALNQAGTYCHLKFPAIDPNTLSSTTPTLLPADTGDIVDFYGPCNHDPVGYDEVCRQKIQQARREQKFCD